MVNCPDAATAADAPCGERELGQADAIAMALVRLYRMTACVQTRLSKAGMERSAFVLLATLVVEGPHRLSTLAEGVHADPSTVSRQVAHLVKSGLIERQSDPSDGRATVLAATAEGVALFERHRRERNTAIAGVVAQWPGADREQFARLLERFTLDYERNLPDLLVRYGQWARSENMP